MCEFNLNAPKLRCAFGNSEDKLSLSKIIYSMQQACMGEIFSVSPQWNRSTRVEKKKDINRMIQEKVNVKSVIG